MKPKKNIQKGIVGILSTGAIALTGCGIEQNLPKDLIDGKKTPDDYAWVNVPYNNSTLWGGYMNEKLKRIGSNWQQYCNLVREKNNIGDDWNRLNINHIEIFDADKNGWVQISDPDFYIAKGDK